MRIPAKIINKYGAVSRVVAGLMARQIARSAHTDLGLSTTGIAGPAGATKTKPIGLVYIGLAIRNKRNIVKRYQFHGTRVSIKEQAAQAALALLKGVI